MYKRDSRIVLILFALFSFFSFGTILLFNFALDDFTILYYQRHNQTLFYPYYAMSYIFNPLIMLFGLEPVYYYAFSFLLFIITSLVIYFYSYLLFKNNFSSFMAGFFYIFSFVGSDALYTMSEGIRINEFILTLFSTLMSFTFYSQTHNKKYFVISIFFAFITVLFFPYRAHMLILYLLFTYLFIVKSVKIKYLIISFLPFIFIYYLIYYVMPRFFFFDSKIHTLPKLFAHLNLHTLQNFTKTVQSVFIPHTSTLSIYNIDLSSLSLLPSVFFLCLTTFILLLKNKKLLLIYSLLLLGVAGFVFIFGDYYISYDRYLFAIRPFYAILTAGIIWRLMQYKNKILYLLFPVVISLAFIPQYMQHRKYQEEITQDRRYGKELFDYIRGKIKSLPNFSIVYFDGNGVPEINRISRVTDVGVLPHSGSLAVYYNKDYEKIEVVFDCESLKKMRVTWKKNQPKTFYFYATEDTIEQRNEKEAITKCNKAK